MIIVNVTGGLGNQMFQYAAARALTMRRSIPLKLDISEFYSYNLHQGFELADIFSCSFDIASVADLREMLGLHASVKVRNTLSRFKLKRLQSAKFVMEPGICYWSDLDCVPNECYLKGYWQSERYFSSFADQIRRDFEFREALNVPNQSAAKKILSVNSVSLHIRRGDYLTNYAAKAVHGLCSLQYYEKAIEYILNNTCNPEFFVFSDDIDWAKRNLNFHSPFYFIDFNHGKDSYNDMRLMSLCNHHIIANSSFSWWGAWLNPSPSKLVLAPQPWFDNPLLDSRDLIPDGWTQVKK